jgi:hypothetical protein
VHNKFGGLCLSPLTRPMISSRESPIDVFQAMQEGMWLIINLSEAGLGKELQQRVGQLFQCALKTATMRRLRAQDRPPFLVICDEYPVYKSRIMSEELLRQSRNADVGLIFLCQDTAPFSDAEFFILVGNCATVGAGRCSRHDAEAMAGEIFLYRGATWRDWDSTRNNSPTEELRAYAALIMSRKEGQEMIRVSPDDTAYFLDHPYTEYPPEDPDRERAFRAAVATHWYHQPPSVA